MKNPLLPVILVFVLILAGCSSLPLPGKSAATVEVLVQVAAIEASARMSPAGRAELKRTLGVLSSYLTAAAKEPTLSGTQIVVLIRATGTLADRPDVTRYLSEAALIVDTQWSGLTIDRARVLSLARKFDEVSVLL